MIVIFSIVSSLRKGDVSGDRTIGDGPSLARCWVNYCAAQHLREPVMSREFISRLEEENGAQNHTTLVGDLGGATTDTQRGIAEFEGLGNDTADPLPNERRLVQTKQSPAVELQEEIRVQIQTTLVRNLGKATAGFEGLGDDTEDPLPDELRLVVKKTKPGAFM